MANLPQSLSMNAPFGGPSASAPGAAGAPPSKDRKMASAEHLVLDLSNPDLRENALLELSKDVNDNQHRMQFAVSIWKILGSGMLEWELSWFLGLMEMVYNILD
uniref:Uncharacterized protein n=1 Tax=Quercus lobata TaxID=97700 RepID=A0A7N2M8Q9_QUELO